MDRATSLISTENTEARYKPEPLTWQTGNRLFEKCWKNGHRIEGVLYRRYQRKTQRKQELQDGLFLLGLISVASHTQIQARSSLLLTVHQPTTQCATAPY